MKKLAITLSALTIFLFFSCSKKPDVGGTAVQNMANEWWVTLDLGGTADVYGIGHQKIKMYNTSANNDSIWIDDYPAQLANGTWVGNVWGFKVKAVTDLNNLTFNSNHFVNALPGYEIKVNITDGKIIVNGGKSKTGNITDSIHMKIEFEDDPGKIYEINGHARTRFAEDDY
jgi:hypothetical protein